MAFELGALVPYSDQAQRGYHLASFVPSRPMLGRQFTTSVSLDGQDEELFSFTVPMAHETLSSVGPEDARLLDEAANAIIAALPESHNYDESHAKAALAKSRLPDGVELIWPLSAKAI
ncbi:MAG: hypothetical protein JWR21_520 [Herminiimonas sp.]|nr:hypothetical protein [Herminiimonas sp.]MDB5852696.1 hypothetical protein [Herminiimonas sp.]